MGYLIVDPKIVGSAGVFVVVQIKFESFDAISLLLQCDMGLTGAVVMIMAFLYICTQLICNVYGFLLERIFINELYHFRKKSLLASNRNRLKFLRLDLASFKFTYTLLYQNIASHFQL